MKRVKLALALTSRRQVTLYLPIVTFRNLSSSQKISKFLAYLSLAGVFLWLFLFFFSSLWADRSFEYLGFSYFMVGMLCIAGLYVVRLILGGRKVLIDPPGLLTVLVFALATTTASVSVTPPTIANTFGAENLKALSGLVVMAALGLFYFTQVYISNTTRFKAALKSLILGLGAFVLYVILKSQYDAFGILLLFMTLPLLFSSLVFSQKYRVLLLPLALVVFYIVAKYGFGSGGFFDPVAHVWIMSLFISVTTVIFALAWYKPSLITKEVSTLKKFTGKESLDTYLSLLDKLLGLIMLLSPILLFLYLAYLLRNDHALDTAFEGIYDDLATAWNLIKLEDASTFETAKTLLIGLGGAKVVDSLSLFANALIAQGLLGLVSYLFIWLYGIYSGINLFIKSINRPAQLYKLFAGLLVILIFVPVISLFIYPSIYASILWWISFSLVVSSGNFIDLKKQRVYTDIDFNVSRWSLLSKRIGKKSIFVQYALCVLVSVLTVLIGYSLLDVLSDIKY